MNSFENISRRPGNLRKFPEHFRKKINAALTQGAVWLLYVQYIAHIFEIENKQLSVYKIHVIFLFLSDETVQYM
jgi:hypothetical protein